MKAIDTDTLDDGTYFDAPMFLDQAAAGDTAGSQDAPAAPLTRDSRGYILTAPEISVTSELIARLKKWGFAAVFTDGAAADKPAHEAAAQETGAMAVVQHDLADSKRIGQARVVYTELSTTVAAIFEQYRQEGLLNPRALSDRVKAIAAAVKELGHYLIGYSELAPPHENYLVAHTVHTTILALAIGLLLKRTPHQLIELGTAALLHDLGMSKLPAELYAHPEGLDEKGHKTLIAHTVLGYRAIKAVSIAESVALTALEHHEHTDGSGYPRRLRGDNINPNAKLVAIASAYDLHTHAQGGVRAAGHQTIIDLLKYRDIRYDPLLVMALVRILAVYPLGSCVELSTGARGVVCYNDQDAPRFPAVKVMVGEDGKPLAEPVFVQTAEDSGVVISRNLIAAEIAALAG